MKKITNREKILMILAFLVIAVVLFDRLFMSPLKEDVAGINAEISKKEDLLFGLRSQQSGYNSISSDLERAINDYNSTIGRFPEKWDDPEMLRFIEDTIGDDIIKNSLSFNGLVKQKDYSVGTYMIAVHGNFEDIIDMFYDFENSKYFNEITNINFPKYSYENEEIDVTFTVNFYVLAD